MDRAGAKGCGREPAPRAGWWWLLGGAGSTPLPRGSAAAVGTMEAAAAPASEGGRRGGGRACAALVRKARELAAENRLQQSVNGAPPSAGPGDSSSSDGDHAQGGMLIGDARRIAEAGECSRERLLRERLAPKGVTSGDGEGGGGASAGGTGARTRGTRAGERRAAMKSLHDEIAGLLASLQSSVRSAAEEQRRAGELLASSPPEESERRGRLPSSQSGMAAPGTHSPAASQTQEWGGRHNWSQKQHSRGSGSPVWRSPYTPRADERRPSATATLFEHLKWYLESQRTRALELFREFDKQRKGWLSHSQIGGLAERLMPSVSAAQVRFFTVMVDANGDGQVTYKELVRAVKECDAISRTLHGGTQVEASDVLRRLASKLVEEHAAPADAFRRYDKDGSGYLEPGELAHMVRLLLPAINCTEIRHILGHMALLDRNDDGRVSYRELVHALLEVCASKRTREWLERALKELKASSPATRPKSDREAVRTPLAPLSAAVASQTDVFNEELTPAPPRDGGGACFWQDAGTSTVDGGLAQADRAAAATPTSTVTVGTSPESAHSTAAHSRLERPFEDAAHVPAAPTSDEVVHSDVLRFQVPGPALVDAHVGDDCGEYQRCNWAEGETNERMRCSPTERDGHSKEVSMSARILKHMMSTPVKSVVFPTPGDIQEQQQEALRQAKECRRKLEHAMRAHVEEAALEAEANAIAAARIGALARQELREISRRSPESHGALDGLEAALAATSHIEAEPRKEVSSPLGANLGAERSADCSFDASHVAGTPSPAGERVAEARTSPAPGLAAQSMGETHDEGPALCVRELFADPWEENMLADAAGGAFANIAESPASVGYASGTATAAARVHDHTPSASTNSTSTAATPREGAERMREAAMALDDLQDALSVQTPVAASRVPLERSSLHAADASTDGFAAESEGTPRTSNLHASTAAAKTDGLHRASTVSADSVTIDEHLGAKYGPEDGLPFTDSDERPRRPLVSGAGLSPQPSVQDVESPLLLRSRYAKHLLGGDAEVHHTRPERPQPRPQPVESANAQVTRTAQHRFDLETARREARNDRAGTLSALAERLSRISHQLESIEVRVSDNASANAARQLAISSTPTSPRPVTLVESGLDSTVTGNARATHAGASCVQDTLSQLAGAVETLRGEGTRSRREHESLLDKLASLTEKVTGLVENSGALGENARAPSGAAACCANGVSNDAKACIVREQAGGATDDCAAAASEEPPLPTSEDQIMGEFLSHAQKPSAHEALREEQRCADELEAQLEVHALLRRTAQATQRSLAVPRLVGRGPITLEAPRLPACREKREAHKGAAGRARAPPREQLPSAAEVARVAAARGRAAVKAGAAQQGQVQLPMREDVGALEAAVDEWFARRRARNQTSKS